MTSMPFFLGIWMSSNIKDMGRIVIAALLVIAF
jgi:hypothetical protein